MGGGESGPGGGWLISHNPEVETEQICGKPKKEADKAFVSRRGRCHGDKI